MKSRLAHSYYYKYSEYEARELDWMVLRREKVSPFGGGGELIYIVSCQRLYGYQGAVLRMIKGDMIT